MSYDLTKLLKFHGFRLSRIFKKLSKVEKIFFMFLPETWWAYSMDKNKIFLRGIFKKFILQWVMSIYMCIDHFSEQQHVFVHNFLHIGAMDVIFWYSWCWWVDGSNEHKNSHFGSVVFELQFVHETSFFHLRSPEKNLRQFLMKVAENWNTCCLSIDK